MLVVSDDAVFVLCVPLLGGKDGVESFYFLAEEQDLIVVFSDLVVLFLELAALGLQRRFGRRKFDLLGGQVTVLLPKLVDFPLNFLEIEGETVVLLDKGLIVLLVALHLNRLEGIEVTRRAASVLRSPGLILELFVQLFLFFLEREDLDPVFLVFFS